MSESEPSKRRLGTGGELVLGALIGAVLGWPITKALDGWASESKLPWWVYLLGSIVGIAVVLLIMSFFIKRWRQTFWGRIGLGVKWLWSWHPVSARRSEALRELDRLRILVEVPTIVRKVISDEKAEHDELMKDNEQLIKALTQQRIYATHAEAEANDAATRRATAPPPAPRWSIRFPHEQTVDTLILSNHVPRSVAREVRIEGDSHITITSAGTWRDLSGGAEDDAPPATGEFTGELSSEAWRSGVNFTITWYDHDGLQRSATNLLQPSAIQRQSPF